MLLTEEQALVRDTMRAFAAGDVVASRNAPELDDVVKAIRRRIEELGGEVRFLTRVEDLHFDETGLKGVMTSSGFIPTSVVVLAIGHSARDTYEMLLRRGVPMEQKPFQMGVRI